MNKSKPLYHTRDGAITLNRRKIMKTNTNKEGSKLLWQVTLIGVITYIALYILKTATRYQEWKSE